MSYFLCATIILVAQIMGDPHNPNAMSYVELIGSLAKFLDSLQQKEGLDLGRFVMGCTVFERISRDAVDRANEVLCNQRQTGTADTESRPVGSAARENARVSCSILRGRKYILTRAQKLAVKLSEASDYMLLAHGLMGNVPILQAAAYAVFADVLASLDHGASAFFSLAPDSLQPSTYGFGSVPKQATPTGLHSGHAVYTDELVE